MERAGALLLTFLLLLTCGGYFGVFLLVQHRAGAQLESRLDQPSGNEKADLVLMTPVALPYQGDRQIMRNSRESLVVGGQHFTALSRSIIHDTLYTYFVRDAYTNQLYGNLNRLIQLTAGQPLSTRGNVHPPDNLLREYLPLNASGALPVPATTEAFWRALTCALPPDPQIRPETPPPQSLV